MAKYFSIPFAMNGDRKEIPTDKQDDGSISFDEGYGADYEKNKQVDPTAKDISRQEFNSVLHDITGAIGEIQRSGVATWTNEISYNKGATIIHNGAIYTSTINANKNEPPHSSWSSFDLSSYRKLDDLLFNGMMKVQATDDVGTGVFLLDKDGNPRGQMTYNSGGLQFAQVRDDENAQTYTFPSLGGEVVVKPIGVEPRSTIYLSDLGAKNLEDCYDIYEEAVAKLGIKGGKIVFGSGKWVSRNGFTLYSNITLEGMGKGITILTQLNGQNKDILTSKDFDKLKGVGPVKDAPKHIHVRDLTVDGNYLEDYKGASIHVDTTYNNTKGYGVKLFATKFTFNIELVNCAEVGWYSEAVNYTGYDDEHSSHITLDGRVFGKEAMVYRGVPDCNLNHIILGCAGWKATKAERRAECQMSELFEGQPVHIFVSDEADGYTGHHEFGFMHLYGNYNGYGYYCNNTGRLKGNHLVVENCRGGFKSSARTWGSISILEAHNNGRMWSADSSAELYYDIHNLSRQGFTVNAITRQSNTEQSSKISVVDDGEMFKLNLNTYTLGSFTTNDNHVVVANGRGSSFNIVSKSAKGDVVRVSNRSNSFKINSKECSGKVANILSDSVVGCSFDIVSHTDMVVFNNPFNAHPSNSITVSGVGLYNSKVLEGNTNTKVKCHYHKLGNTSQGIPAKNLLSNYHEAKVGTDTISFDNVYYKDLSLNDLIINIHPNNIPYTVDITEDKVTINSDSTTKRVILYYLE